MNKDLTKIIEFLNSVESLSNKDRESLIKTAKSIDKELSVTTFKLERTEKVKRTTAILLEETIEELEQKRKSVELQNRELEIEAALERVRAKAMAMNSPDDLTQTAETFFLELIKLNIKPHRCGFGIVSRDTRSTDIHATTATQGNSLKIVTGRLKLTGHPVLEKIFEGFEKQEEYHPVLKGNEILEYYKVMNPQVQFPDFSDDEIQYGYYFYFKEGGVFAWNDREYSENELEIFRRYTSVLSLTYRRYIDLKQAEAQAWEAQIEAALERVRSKTMAMHNSQDVGETVVTLFDEVLKLGLDKSIRCGIGILDKSSDIMETWSATSHSNGEVDLQTGLLDMTIHPLLVGLKKAWNNDETGYKYKLFGNDLIEYYNALNNEPEYPIHIDIDALPENIYHNSFFYTEGILFAFTSNPVSDESAKVLSRFAGVFGQTYRRYLDLLKAEAQARESQIEASLEKVRARTMAMHKSSELAQTTAHLFAQLYQLGIKPYRCNIAIVDEGSSSCNLWSTTNNGNVIPTGSALPLNEYPVLQYMYDGWKSKKSNHIIKLSGKERLEWSKYIGKYLPFQEYKPKNIDESALLEEPAFLSNLYFKQGFFTIHTLEELSEKDLKIIQRFVYVFEQTYTRFLDLENAEKQNKLIQAENERKTQELEEARELQLAMLPTELPKMPNLEIAVYMQTATEVGGDYYDFHVDDEGILTGVIGDATGHGMKAGTIVTITKSMFNSLASENNILDTLTKISKVIKDMKFRQLSMCLMMFRIEDNTVAISSAAMPPALIYRNTKNKVEEYELRGMPLGAMKNFPYKLVETKLHPGDTLLMMSDGFPELLNDKNFMYGYDKTKSEFCSVGEKTPNEIVEHLTNSASQWLNGRDPDDDVTFVVIKIK